MLWEVKVIDVPQAECQKAVRRDSQEWSANHQPYPSSCSLFMSTSDSQNAVSQPRYHFQAFPFVSLGNRSRPLVEIQAASRPLRSYTFLHTLSFVPDLTSLKS